MVQPIDYMVGTTSPMDRMVQGIGAGQAMRVNEQDMAATDQRMGIAASEEARRAQEFEFQQSEAERQRQSALALQEGMVGLVEKIQSGSATWNDFADISLRHPEVSDELKSVWDGMTVDRRKNDAAGLYKAASALKAGRPDLAAQMFEDYAAAAENSGQKMDADLARAMAAMAKASPEAALANIGMMLGSLDEEGAKNLFGARRSVQSSSVLDDGTTVTVFNDGSKEVTDATGAVLKGQAATDAIKGANEYSAEIRRNNAAGSAEGRLQTAIDMGGQAKAAEEAGKQSIAKSGEAFDTLGKVNQNIRTIDEAIAAIDAGANAGAVARFFPDVSSASASLANAMNRLGLDVISSVTFGALSEGEMKLAMETAVPRNLDEGALRAWLEDKRAAQEKASEALYNAAVYLGTPGNTLAGWLKEQKAGGSGSQPTASPPSPSATPAPKGVNIDGYVIEELP